MKKILLSLLSLTLASSSTLVTSCKIDPDPFHYLPTKFNIDYGYLKDTDAIGFMNTGSLEIDFSPLIIEAIKKGANANLENDRYQTIVNQFVSEYDYFKWFKKVETERPTIDYLLNHHEEDINEPMRYESKSKDEKGNEKIESFPMNQIVRVDNYREFKEFPTNQDELLFKVRLKKYNFKFSDTNQKNIGYYESTNQTTNFKVYINGINNNYNFKIKIMQINLN